MKCLIATVVILLGLCQFAYADDVLEIISSAGPDTNRLDIVILGDGYTDAQADLFRQHSTELIAAISEASPWKEYAEAVNWYRVVSTSLESGADHPAQSQMVDTYFDSYFDCNDIARLLCADTQKVAQVALGLVPQAEHILLIVNDDTYGGSGGGVAISSINSAASLIIIHELGHTVSGLADTYTTPYPGFPPGDPEPNVDFDSTLADIKWNHWIESATPLPTSDGAATGDLTPIGAYEGARYLETGIYRPAPECLMRSLGIDFCAVCEEASIVSLYSVFSPVDGVTPAIEQVVSVERGITTPFTIEILAVDSIAVQWTLDGEDLATGPVLEFRPGNSVENGTHQLMATIADTTDAVRVAPAGLLSESYTWNVDVFGEMLVEPDAGNGGEGGEGEQDDPGGNLTGGCGCQNASGTGPWVFGIFLILWISRRRLIAVSRSRNE